MEFTTKAEAKRLTGISYLGSVSQTVKHKKSIKFGELTYSLYLAPAITSGYEVCPGRTVECTKFCLNESGMNTMNMNNEMINRSRIQKTKLFFEEPNFFMGWVIDEIKSAQIKATKLGFLFSVRINNTSDINPADMIYNGKNILEIFPDTQFYDYTKVNDRVELLSKYPNYDLTFSYTGYNWGHCEEMLKNNVRVAVVFKKVPETFNGYKVIDGDISDLRTRDEKNVIVGLKYKTTRQKLNEKIKFVVQ